MDINHKSVVSTELESGCGNTNTESDWKTVSLCPTLENTLISLKSVVDVPVLQECSN